LKYEIHTKIDGDPAKAILRAADELKVDSVVMATHGRKGLGRLILGSVAERVVRESPRPVLTVRPTAESA
jgi:nucleotide-binding universal stress UspA family protein